VSERLRDRLDALEARQRLNDAADAALELALRDRLPLQHTLEQLLPILVAHTGAQAAWIRTFNEDLELRDFSYPRPGAFPMDPEEVVALTETGEQRVQRQHDEGYVVAQRVDVAGEFFGAAGVAFETRPDPLRISLIHTLLDTWCEELDNYLASIARARRKHVVTRKLSDALKAPVLDEGVRAALAVLKDAVPYDDLLLVFRHEEEIGRATLSYHIVQGGETTHDSGTRDDMEVDEFIRAHAAPLIRGESRDLLERFGLDKGREEVLIEGLHERQVMGRVVVTSQHGDFNTYDRDLLECFADYLRQRIVDFNRQWKRLSQIFPREAVRRVLSHGDFRERFLTPRTEDVAILFCDISGFTRISEQILRDPAKVGRLIDVWGEAVVEILWETGGVFDKMVGDCVIAFWGPPFFEDDARDRCLAAIDATKRIRDFTRGLRDGKLLPDLEGVEIGVASGLHYGSVSIGLFGPDEDYTAFSSVMNNTARLQGVAVRDEILCMRELVSIVGDGAAFGESRQAEVKNVAEPLRFRALE